MGEGFREEDVDNDIKHVSRSKDSTIEIGLLPTCNKTTTFNSTSFTHNNHMSPSSIANLMETSNDLAFRQTFNYDLARRNFIQTRELLTEKPLDIHKYHPIFVVDVLQLPGSLASILELNSCYELTLSMTVGTLSVVSRLGQIVKIQGMCVLGRSTKDQDTLDRFYGPQYSRRLVQIHIKPGDEDSMMITAMCWMVQ